MIACEVTDLPDPDSPTTHTISPGATENDTFSTALTRSAPAGRRTVRPCTSRTDAVIGRPAPGCHPGRAEGPIRDPCTPASTSMANAVIHGSRLFLAPLARPG